MNNAPVGFFDSGVGGLCILEAFKKECPNESTIYIADSKHCPYGNKSADVIIKLAEANTQELLREGAKMVVVACNTATAAAIDFLRVKYPNIPFIGLEPAIKPAALKSKRGIVAVLATAGTFNGRLYNETKRKFASEVTIIAVVADEFVSLVEASVTERGVKFPKDAKKIVEAKIKPLIAAGADKIVLGCTHFPHLRPLIEAVAGEGVEVIDPSTAVAHQASRVLKLHSLSASSRHEPKHIFHRL